MVTSPILVTFVLGVVVHMLMYPKIPERSGTLIVENVFCASQRTQVVTLAGGNVRVGVPDEVRNRIIRLINLWDRADPPVHGAVGPRENKSRGPRGGRGGGPAGAARGGGGKSEGKGKGTEPGVKLKCSEQESAQERKAAAGRVMQWLLELPSRRGLGEQYE